MYDALRHMKSRMNFERGIMNQILTPFLVSLGLILIPESVFGRDILITTKSDSILEKQLEEAGHIDPSRFEYSAESVDSLSFDMAIALALAYHPLLQAKISDIRIAEAEVFQSSRKPNPELEVELENFAGSHEFAGMNSSESVVAIGQTFELPGKRHKRHESSNLNRTLAVWDYRELYLEVYTHTSAMFIGVLAAQEKVRLAEELADLAKKFSATIESRVQRGSLSPVELSRARIEQVNAKVDLDRARKNLASARLELASIWNGNKLAVSQVSGTIRTPAQLPPIETMMLKLTQNPGLARWESEKAYVGVNYQLEKANRIPDPSFSLGMSNPYDSDEAAFVAGFSILLPIFDRNKGSIMAAAEEITQTDWYEIQAQTQLKTDLTSAYLSLKILLSEIESYESVLTPESQSVFEKISDGYNRGKYDFLEVLDAQRVLFEIRRDYIDLLLESNLIYVTIEGLVNQRIADLNYQDE